jgi:hypothetical protein
MKKLNIGAKLFCRRLSIVIMLLTLPAEAMDIDDAPETVTIDYLQELYEAVNFDHRIHAETFACNACHHHTTGGGPQNDICGKCHADSGASDDVSCSGCHQEHKTAPSAPASRTGSTLYHIDKPAIKGALHLQCLGCHRADGGPTGCQDCHAFTRVGRKRFAVSD